MPKVKFYTGIDIPLEFHRARIVQKVRLLPIDERLEALKKGGYNTYRMDSADVYLDMLTDSGTNAMSDLQLAAMMRADDAYAGSESFKRLEKAVFDVLGKRYVVPAHQGRAAENVIMRAFLKPGDIIPMNYHFGSTVNHIKLNGGRPVDLVNPEVAFSSASDNQFKGNIDIARLEDCIAQYGAEHIPCGIKAKDYEKRRLCLGHLLPEIATAAIRERGIERLDRAFDYRGKGPFPFLQQQRIMPPLPEGRYTPSFQQHVPIGLWHYEHHARLLPEDRTGEHGT